MTTANTMRERGARHRYTLWVLLNANRWLLTAALAAGAFLVLIGWGVARPPPIPGVMATTDWVEMSFQALIGALITGTTLVVSINQLVLSQRSVPWVANASGWTARWISTRTPTTSSAFRAPPTPRSS